MIEAGHTSAYSVYATGREHFVGKLAAAGSGRPPRPTRSSTRPSRSSTLTTLTLLGNFNQAFTSATPSAVSQLGAARAPVAAGELPDAAVARRRQRLLRLRGLPRGPRCRGLPRRHPAIPQAPAGDHRLRTRGPPCRGPDLGVIELVARHERRRALHRSGVRDPRGRGRGADPGRGARARDLGGHPQERRAIGVRHDAAYNTLATAVSPMRGCSIRGPPRSRAFPPPARRAPDELMAAFQLPAVGAGEPTPTDTAIAGERLGLSAAALRIAATHGHAGPAVDALGPPGAPPTRSPSAAAAATAIRTGTGPADPRLRPDPARSRQAPAPRAVELLATRFINPGYIRFAPANPAGFASCDTGKQTITTWTADALSRFGRFLRLWRQLGCTIWDLDKAL